MQTSKETGVAAFESTPEAGNIRYAAIHKCPVCGHVQQCFTVDRYHNCELCGSVWRN